MENGNNLGSGDVTCHAESNCQVEETEKKHRQSMDSKNGGCGQELEKKRKDTTNCRKHPVTIGDLLELLDRQDRKCALTGRPLTPESCSLDHRIPISRGGDHDITNCQLVVPEANAAKGTMSQEDFLALCRDVARAHPPPVRGR